MNERSLSRRLSTSVVDTLKSQGHILVVKGGATALTRELDELMSPLLVTIAPRLGPRALVGGEITSTFGDESVDEAVEDMVARMTRAFMDSDHVEDVFAEDNVIRRDIFRTVRDGLLRPAWGGEGEAEDDEVEGARVKLDTLGYVAKEVSQRADAALLEDALERAGAIAQARLISYSADAREAAFTLDADSPDGRLELEEAIADELADLVDRGLVELPTIERRVDLEHKVAATDMKTAKVKIAAIAQKTFQATGCAATWDLTDGSTLKVTIMPLSDQDALDVDRTIATFGRAVNAAFVEVKPPKSVRTPKVEPEAPPPLSKRAKPAAAVAAVAISPPESVRPPVSSGRAKAASAVAAAKSVAPKSVKPAAKKVAAKAPAKKPAAKAPTKKAAAKPAAKKKSK